MATKKNIIIGAAQVYLGPAGTVKPAFVAGTRYSGPAGSGATLRPDTATGATSGTGSAVTDWKEVGYTQDGLEVTTDPTWDDVEVDQMLDSVKTFKSGMSVSIATTFAEATLENLLIAWGQASTSVSSVAAFENELAIEAGALGSAPIERGLIAIGNAIEKAASNSYGERVYHAYRVLSVEGATHTLARSEATTIPVTFRALPDDATQRYGLVRDRLNV